jgi:hypothetical protein
MDKHITPDRMFLLESNFGAGFVQINFAGEVTDVGHPLFRFIIDQGMTMRELEAYAKVRGWRFHNYERKL